MTTAGVVVPEVQVLRTACAKRVLDRWLPGWRWDVTWYQTSDERVRGVFDCRVHQRCDFGYTWTKWGAWRRVRRAYQAREL